MDLSDAVHDLFQPARRPQPGRIGLEVELIALPTRTDGTDPCAALAGAFDPGFVARARPTFEPGGQLELSPAPRPSAALAVQDAASLAATAQTFAASRGISLVGAGTDPMRSCADVPLRRREPRYIAMQEQFDEVGPDGRRMMRLTASLQVCVDLLAGPEGHEQWALANLAGPALAARYANSPWLDGQASSVPGTRTAIWCGADMRRTGYDGRHLDPRDPVGAYDTFAAAAPRLPIREAADPRYHLSTLFPPVRPRSGYLEIRYLDAQPIDAMAEPVHVIATLLYDAAARREALALLAGGWSDLAEWWQAASSGIAPHADDLVQLATEHARRSRSGSARVLGGVR